MPGSESFWGTLCEKARKPNARGSRKSPEKHLEKIPECIIMITAPRKVSA